MTLVQICPKDWRDALLVGRLDAGAGPVPRDRGERTRPRRIAQHAHRSRSCSTRGPARSRRATTSVRLDELADHTCIPGDAKLRLLAPCDSAMHQGLRRHLRCFGRRAGHRRAGARRLRARHRPFATRLGLRVGADIRSVQPGSATAARLKEALIADGLWSQYLEVAIGPDAEVFTKSPVLSSVGWGDWIGVRSESQWNNPEPEIVLACDARGRVRSARARQRREPARHRRPQRAAARQSEGQQRVLRNRSVHPHVRPALLRSTTCAAPWSRSKCTARTAIAWRAAARCR